MSEMRVVHTVGSLGAWAGGPSRTVTRLCTSLAELGADVHLVAAHRPAVDGRLILPSSESVHLHLAQAGRFLLSPGFRTGVRRAVEASLSAGAPVLLHDHGLWLRTNHWVAGLACRTAVPRAVHLRGMLEPWALDYRGWKKQLALRLYQRRDLDSAALFFVTATQELESVRRLGLRQPVAVIPNGVDMPDPGAHDPQAERAAEVSRSAVFLGRIHPKKGLLNLIEVWAQVRPPGWRLKVAGPDEGGHLAEVMRRVRERGLESSVEYLGTVEGGDKARLLAEADLFILPSFSENFGVVVAEALAHGTPVIVTRGTPWAGLVEQRCGWWVEPTVPALAQALREAVAMHDLERAEWAGRARRYAANFAWRSIATQTLEVYRWLLGLGPRPACVVTD